MKKTVLALLVALLFAGALWAARYRITVTRESTNLYRIEYSHPETYLRTRHCYAYAYHDEALFDESQMWLYFLNSDEECEVARVIR